MNSSQPYKKYKFRKHRQTLRYFVFLKDKQKVIIVKGFGRTCAVQFYFHSFYKLTYKVPGRSSLFINFSTLYYLPSVAYQFQRRRFKDMYVLFNIFSIKDEAVALNMKIN